jgi:Zn finger protein HypA/HybF involved in hydrogenase expression
MHELSVAMAVCQMAEDRVGGTALPYVTRIGLTVGDEAGIDPSNLAFCLDALLATPPFTGARAELTRCAGDALRVDYLEVDDDRACD